MLLGVRQILLPYLQYLNLPPLVMWRINCYKCVLIMPMQHSCCGINHNLTISKTIVWIFHLTFTVIAEENPMNSATVRLEDKSHKSIHIKIASKMITMCIKILIKIKIFRTYTQLIRQQFYMKNIAMTLLPFYSQKLSYEIRPNYLR